MAEEFLDKKVRVILEPMVSSVLIEKPREPVLFMIEWLQNFAGLKSSGINGERTELDNLKKEMKKYKMKYAKEDEEMLIASDEDNDNEDQEEVDDLIDKKRNQNALKAQRISVSAEVYGEFNKKEAFVARVIKKNKAQKQRIMKRCMQSFIFNSLDDNELETVIDAFEEMSFKAGQTVIEQGEHGDVVYLVDSGELDCYKVLNKGDNATFLKTYVPGESFGELALLYNSPRAATIVCKTDSVLWALDRATFNHIVKDAAMKKREKYENILSSVELLQTIDRYELGQICDALKSEKVEAGTVIIKQNDNGDKFYILEEGRAYATKVFDNGVERTVMDYQKGSYFGELALIRNEPRAASVIAQSDCKLLVLDRLAFKRLLGPVESLLKRNSEAYIKFIKK